MSKRNRILWLDWLSDRAFRSVIGALRLLPWGWRTGLMGHLCAYVIGPLAGYRKRAEAHLAYIHPDMPKAERRCIARAALDNMGRTIIENYAPKGQVARYAGLEPTGPGWPALRAALEAGRPVLLITGHFGNWQVVRVALNARGADVVGLYRPFNNRFSNDHYVWSFEAVGGTAFPRTRRGLAGFLRVLREGGQAAMMVDQYVSDGAVLDFLGKPAATTLSAAEMALRHDALLVPVYGIRQADTSRFVIEVEPPIPHSDARTMTQALNDSLGAQITRHPGQWFWFHRRWKPERLARKAAKRAAEGHAG